MSRSSRKCSWIIQNLAKPPLMRICRGFENWCDLRASSGKFLRQKSCYPESFRFLWLWLVCIVMVSEVSQYEENGLWVISWNSSQLLFILKYFVVFSWHILEKNGKEREFIAFSLYGIEHHADCSRSRPSNLM